MRGLSVPTITRSGFMKSAIAAPSFRNSGFETTSKSTCTPRAISVAPTVALTLSDVPTGTVDLVITTLYSSMCSPIVRATASTWRRSAEPSSSGGVPTAMIWNRPWATAALASVVNCEPALVPVAGDHLVEARLVDRDLAGVQARDLGRVDVDADHVVAGVRQAGAGHETDVT